MDDHRRDLRTGMHARRMLRSAPHAAHSSGASHLTHSTTAAQSTKILGLPRRIVVSGLVPLVLASTAILLFILFLVFPSMPTQPTPHAASSQNTTSTQTFASHGSSPKTTTATKTASAVPTATIDWRDPTGGTQPNLAGKSNLSVDVDLVKQQATVAAADGTVLYTMLVSSGMNDATPHGDFTIGQRGLSFYTPAESMGAKWWTAFLGTKYLFHSVPTTIDGAYIASEGAKLGTAASHGCVRLSVADAKWFYEQIPTGTHVHIH